MRYVKILFEAPEQAANLLKKLDMLEILYIMLIGTAAIILAILAGSNARYAVTRNRLTMGRDSKHIEFWINRIISGKGRISGCIRALSNKVVIYYGISYEKSVKLSITIIIVLAASAVLIFTFLFPRLDTVWYVFAAYIVLGVMFLFVIAIVLQMMYRSRFMKSLPQTYKIINSRYISTGNIIKAISVSIESGEFRGSMRNVMRMIKDVLMKNDMYVIENTFKIIEENYRNDYLTLLLNLIKQAHYKGGEATIRRQFEQATEEVLLEIENSKDLASTARMYIVLALMLPAGIIGIEKFNISALGIRAEEYYNSPSGLEMKLVIIGMLIIFVGFMLFMERTG